MPKQGWRTVRVVVEVPACGDFSEKDLRWTVARLVGDGEIDRDANKFKKVELGRTLIKEYSKVRAYEKRKENDAHQE